MNEQIYQMQLFVIYRWILNTDTQYLLDLSYHCFEDKFHPLVKELKSQYIDGSNVDIANLSTSNFTIAADITDQAKIFSFKIESCIEKLNAHRQDKAMKYIATKILNGISASEAIDLLNQKEEMNKSKVSKGSEIALKSYEKIVDKFEKGSIQKIGLRAFDNLVGDFDETGLFIIGGTPSSGKTTLGLNVVRSLAEQGHKSLVFSLEMTAQALMKRILIADSYVDAKKIKHNNLESRDFERLANSIKKDWMDNIHIEDEGISHINDIVSKAISLHKEHNYKMIMIDYLQLINADGGSLREIVTHANRALVSLKKKLGIPIVVIASLNRGPASRADKRPVMSDLGESSAIEYGADVILFVHRPFIDNNELDPTECELIVRKFRDGELGIAKQHFDGNHYLFSDYDLRPRD